MALAERARDEDQRRLSLVTTHAGKGARDHHGPYPFRLMLAARLPGMVVDHTAEAHNVLVCLHDALFENVLERPRLIGLRELRVAIGATGRFRIALLHKHVTHVEEESLE